MRTANIIKTLVWMALLAGMSVAGVKYVAVVETGVDERSGASSMLNSAEVALITAELRRVAVENLPRDKYNVMTSETVQSMGGAVLEECAEENCVITLGSKIGADYIVRGTVSKFQSMLTLSVEMYETDNGTLVSSLSPIRSENAVELLEKGAEACGEMYRKFAGTKPLTAREKKKAEKAAQKEAAGSYTINTYTDNSLEYQYKDFSTWRRGGAGLLNYVSCMSGLGSFVLMKDYVGGGIVAGSTAVGMLCVLPAIQAHNRGGIGTADVTVGDVLTAVGMVAIMGGQVFSIYRVSTYHKPRPKSANANANNIKPYDGLKLTVLPTESGAYKFYARYDYTF